MNNMADNKKTLFSIISNSFTSVITIIVSLVTTVIITRVLSVGDVGIAASFSSLRSIFAIICLLAVYVSINRILLDVKGKDFEFLSSIYIFSSLFCLVTFILYLLFRNVLNPILGFDTKLMTLMFSIIFLSNGSTIMNSYWNYHGKYKFLLLFNLFSSPIAQIVSIVLSMILIENKYLGRIVGIEIFNVLIGIVCGIYILKKGKFCFNKDYIKKSLKICVPMIPHLLSQILLTSCDLLMIKTIIGNSAAGVYSMAYTISNVFYLIMIQMFMPWSPWVYRRLKNKELESIYNGSQILIIFTAYLALGLFSIAPEMIQIFLPASYINSGLIIAPICIGIYFEIMSIFFYDIEYYHKKTKQISLFSIICAGINILLNYICIKNFGYEAAAYTTLVSYLLLMLMHYFGMRKLDKRKIYNIKFLVIVSILLFIVGMIYIISNNNIIIRYISLLAITVFLFIKYRKMTVDLLKQIRNKN